ncbi:hypothetical protein D9613_006246 [Agrocybe pediades]|uniref:3-oxo-5-alpha-steroid 4-dehydrogenase C-terminal domain-containing protein n=1 Tax=Agrocybe pediades TaxID=84607 RepID=A0A8H4VRM7_9AGAR|nr:hypothetical protein D9613_006246 [Agrocybe pediades]
MDPTNMFSFGRALYLFNEARKWFTISSVLTAPVLLVIDAPFGRFTPKDQSSFLIVDGRKAWMLMELVSPLMFIYTFVTSPLTAKAPLLPSPTEPHAILAICFLLHYANRAIISPLRTPSRSKTHLIVTVSGIIFNVINGSLMGSYLSSPYGRMYLRTVSSPTFYTGLTTWALGLVGNIYHDEILLNIRRKANSKGKGKNGDDKNKSEHYAIPQGGLYSLISYPNYFCEWVEWFGYALAASPLPFRLSDLSLSTIIPTLLNLQTYKDIINGPASNFAPLLSPPWIFLLSEFLLMLPRAYKGHKWYHSKFGASYPKERKAAIPFIL